MNNDFFAAPHEWMSFWKKAARTAADEWTKLEGKRVEQAGAAIDEMSKLTKETLAYTSQLAAEWRKLTVDALDAAQVAQPTSKSAS